MRIVILDAYTLEGTSLEMICSLGETVIYEDTESEQIINRCISANVIVTNKVEIGCEHICELPNLELICVAATGVNNIDLVAAEKYGVTVKNVPAYSTNSVAEATISMTLALMRNLLFYDNYVKSGVYQNSGRSLNLSHRITQISGKNWGVIGLGAIGRRVAELVTLFGAKVSYYSTSGQNNNSIYEKQALIELLKNSDIISIHAPLSEKTNLLIGAKEIALMKRTAFIINVARGGIIDEKALALAIQNDEIAGAAIDVWEHEPVIENNPIVELAQNNRYKNRLVLAPHSAWSAQEACKILIDKIVQNIQIFYLKNNDQQK